jgi:WD40 repeat protein
VWDLGTGRCKRTLEGHTDLVTALALTGDGRAVLGFEDRTLRVLDLDTGRCLAVFPWDCPITSVAVAPCQPHTAVVGDSQGNVLFFRIENLDRA